jgi:hypothetical protein
VKSLTSLWSCIAEELAIRCCTSAARDITTVVRRTEHEGLSFLAISLANYGKVIEKWLDRGFVVPSEAQGWKASKSHTGLPAFLQGFLGRVFDSASGALLDNPDIEAIYALRQLTLMFSKIALPDGTELGTVNGFGDRKVVSAVRERRAMSDFVQCEQDVKDADARLDPLFREDFRRMSALLFGDMFAKIDREIYWNGMQPKHGPGTVADRLSANAKWNQRTWPARLQRVFPAEEFLIPNPNFRAEIDGLDILEPGSEIPVRVITVPKTLKAPRVIAIEPTAMQYAQQAVYGSMRKSLREDGFLSGLIGIDDQDPNRVMAKSGSHSGELATLDLSEASDRVSNEHVLDLFAGYPHLLEASQACRSRKARVPGHGEIRLAKFASMGSALCFPVEAMVFATIIFLGIERELSAPLSRGSLVKRFRGRVRVFGDDIIAPREHVLSVVNELETFGIRVNVGKSFWIGRFRESCGREYYDGHDVSIVRVRRVLPTRRQDANGVISAVKLRNQLYWAGLWRGAGMLDNKLEDLLRFFPNVAPTSPLLGRESALGYQFQKLDPNYHSPLTKGYKVVAKPPLDKLEGSGALLKCLLRNPIPRFPLGEGGRTGPSVDPRVDTEHLERSGRPKRVSIKLGWSPPY